MLHNRQLRLRMVLDGASMLVMDGGDFHLIYVPINPAAYMSVPGTLPVFHLRASSNSRSKQQTCKGGGPKLYSLVFDSLLNDGHFCLKTNSQCEKISSMVNNPAVNDGL